MHLKPIHSKMITVSDIENALYNNYIIINKNMVESQFVGNITKLSIDMVLNSIMHFHVPYTARWEGLFANDPVDRGGPTMRGVTVGTFCNSIKNIISFLPTGYEDLKTQKLPFPLNTNNATTIQALQDILNKKETATIWIHYFYYVPEHGNLFLVASHDPFMGFMIADKCWMSGQQGCWEHAKFLQATKEMGYTGNPKNFGKWVHTLSARQCAELSSKFISNVVDHLLRLSQPGSSNEKFRAGWLNRAINDTQFSILAKMVQYVEKMYLANVEGANSVEKEWLAELGEAYRSIDFKNLSI